MSESKPVELVRKVYARDLREKDKVQTVFKVAKKSKTTARSGKAFLVVSLVDRTGELDARVFDKVDELEPVFAEGDYLLVEGAVIAFHGKPQLVIEKLEKLDPEPLDPAEFAAPPAADKGPAPAATGSGGGEDGRAPAAVRELVDRLHDSHLKALLRSMLEVPEVAEGLRSGHGPRGTPWAHKGGLAEHLASYARLAARIAEHFPAVDRDLVVAGAVAQLLGRAQGASDRAFESTDRGHLVGAPASAAQLIRERARLLDGFPPLLEQHLTHLALAGVVPPATLEALVLRSARELEDKVGSWLEQMSRDAGGGHWTDPARHEDGALWKGPAPTSRGRAPVEPRKKREREPKPSKGSGPPASKLAFKPLDELAPKEPSAEAAPPPPETSTEAPAEAPPAETPPEPPNPEG
ncbi:MAG TPA: OB-fold nucleic acid binding domain-containing protein [Myxococcaceae bacterium]|nr:OB-fold nucleic acid binding domain-containing protein [Myxococcaceae bacterium]